MTTTIPAYQASFDWVGDPIDGAFHWRCNICDRLVDDEPCPEHAPLHVPGLYLIPCDATPRHPRMWVLNNDCTEWVGTPCDICLRAEAQDRIRKLEHATHRAWRRWKTTRKALRWLYAIGITRGSATVHTSECNGCVTRISWRWSR